MNEYKSMIHIMKQIQEHLTHLQIRNKSEAQSDPNRWNALW